MCMPVMPSKGGACKIYVIKMEEAVKFWRGHSDKKYRYRSRSPSLAPAKQKAGHGNGIPAQEVRKMMIEPISSMMTVQAQGSAIQKPQTVTNENPESAASAGTQEAAKVDMNTMVVENAQEKGQANNGEQGREQSASNEQIRKAVEQFNKSMANSEAVFGIHEGTNRVTIKIVDKDTKKVIKELPPEKTLDMIARVWDMAGILVDEKR